MGQVNEQVARLLQEYADLLAIQGVPGFKIRAYEKAARSIAGHGGDLTQMDVKQLQQIPSVGPSIAEKVYEFVQSGQMTAVEKAKERSTPAARPLMGIPGLGPKKAIQLSQELGVSSVAELEEAVKQGRLEGMRGFGPKSAEKILQGIELLRRSSGRVLVSVALRVAEDYVSALSQVEGCLRCTHAGSLRRMRESIGDVDVLAAAEDSTALMEAFVAHPATAEVIVRGAKKTSVRTVEGLQVDLRVVPLDSWGAALQYFTGSKEHNVRVREIAVRQGLRLSEYGLFRVEGDELLVSRTEEEVYAALGMDWVPPTLREDRGEVAAALSHTLPRLVQVEDLQGDLHTHTNLTDGTASLEKMLAAARALGYAYYAVTDHAPNLVMQRMTDEKMLKQRAKLLKLAAEEERMELLHGSELNIDPDGEVDWGPDFLAGFDLCVASVHSHFNQPRAEMTRRLIRACENPYVNVIGHMTTRLIGRRDPVDADFDAVFKAAARTGTAIEINSFPDRLDVNDTLILQARSHGVKFAIDSDAHAVSHLKVVKYGVGMAQRGWLTSEDVINAWPAERLRDFVSAKRPG